ncbi:MAG: AgmX/PglI C-terminal domain-containing protein [Bdellovibrionales bacterium]|nr:AgmX/PglI C-terminal domain-containing protein [Bdellovibrionales bacterium]
MFNNRRKFKNTFAPASKNDSCLDIVSPDSGSIVEVSTFWKERLLKSYTFSNKGSVYLSNKESDNSVVVPGPYSIKNKAKLLQIKKETVECYPVRDKFSYYSKEGKVSNSALLQSSRIMQKSGQTSIFINQGDLIYLDSEHSDFSITVSYKKPSAIAKAGQLINMSLSETSVLLLSFVALLFLFLYNKAIEIEPPEKEKVTKPVYVSFKKVKKIPVIKTTSNIAKKSSSKKPKKSRAKKKHPVKRKIVVKSKSPKKTKKAPRKGTVFKARRAKRSGSLKGKKSAGIKAKKVDVNSVGLLGVFAKSGKQRGIKKSASGSGGLYGLAKSKTNSGGVGLSDDQSASRFGSGLKGKSGGSRNSTVKLGAGIGTYGSPNGIPGGSVDLGSPSKVSISYAGELGDDFVGGGVDSDGIYRVIQAHKNVIRFCYQKEQDYYPDLEGLVRLHWRINDKGRVVNANIKTLSDSDMKGVGNCIVKNLKTWKFPSAPKSSLQAVEFPFRFKKK